MSGSPDSSYCFSKSWHSSSKHGGYHTSNADVVDRNQGNGTSVARAVPVSFPEVPSSALDSSDGGKLEANVNNSRSLLIVREVTKNHRVGRLWVTDCH